MNTNILSGTSCLVDTAAVNNFLQGIFVNHCLAHPKGNLVQVIMINQNNHNVWIQQPLLAAEIFWVQHIPWDYGVELHQEGNKIEVAFQPLPVADIMASVKVVHDETDKMLLKEKANQEPCPHIWLHPNTKAANFDFKKELGCLAFKLKYGGHSFRQRTPGQIYWFDL